MKDTAQILEETGITQYAFKEYRQLNLVDSYIDKVPISGEKGAGFKYLYDDRVVLQIQEIIKRSKNGLSFQEQGRLVNKYGLTPEIWRTYPIESGLDGLPNYKDKYEHRDRNSLTEKPNLLGSLPYLKEGNAFKMDNWPLRTFYFTKEEAEEFAKFAGTESVQALIKRGRIKVVSSKSKLLNTKKGSKTTNKNAEENALNEKFLAKLGKFFLDLLKRK